MAAKNQTHETLKLGVFGGTFNPLHNGHLNSLATVQRRFGFGEIRVVPAYQSPGRSPVEGASPAQRLEMVKLYFSGQSGIVVDDAEIRRGGMSYTIDTIFHLRQIHPEAEMHLIIGMDQFEHFGEWKDFESILAQTHLVVTSRPDALLPQTEADFPKDLADLVVEFDVDRGEALLEPGNKIYFVQLDDVDVSSTEVRRAIQNGEPAGELLPKNVLDYIKRNQLYEGLGKRIGDFESFTRFCADRLFERKAVNVMGFDVRAIAQPSEYVLIASGTSTRQTTALSDFLVREVKSRYTVYPQSVEGQREGRWVVLDYGALIIHIFYDFTRQEYRLEELWKNAKDLGLKDPVVAKNPNP